MEQVWNPETRMDRASSIPSIPSILFSHAHTHERAHARARAHACTHINFGLEGMEGMEEQAAIRVCRFHTSSLGMEGYGT